MLTILHVIQHVGQSCRREACPLPASPSRARANTHTVRPFIPSLPAPLLHPSFLISLPLATCTCRQPWHGLVHPPVPRVCVPDASNGTGRSAAGECAWSSWFARTSLIVFALVIVGWSTTSARRVACSCCSAWRCACVPDAPRRYWTRLRWVMR